MLLGLSVRVAATIHYYLRAYAPTNILLRRLRKRGGLKWAVPTALALVPTYLFAAAIVTTVIADGGSRWLNLAVLTCIWNAMKFAAQALSAVLRAIYGHFRLDSGIRSLLHTAMTPGPRDGGTVKPYSRDASIRTEVAPWSS